MLFKKPDRMRGSNRIIAAGLFTASLAALASTIYMSGSFGHSLAASEWNRLANANLFIVFESMTALLSLVLGLMIAKKRRLLTAVALSGLIVFAAASVASMVGFATSNRVAVSELHKREGEALIKRHDDAVKARLEHAAWLRQTSVKREIPKSERKQLLTDANDQIKALDAIEPPKLDAAMVTPDGQAELFAHLSGFSVEQVQFAFAIFTALLAIVAISFGQFFAAILWERGSANHAGSACGSSVVQTSGSSTGSDGWLKGGSRPWLNWLKR
jgi:hypothetical protein